MTSEQKIKEGLYYFVNPLFIKRDNNSFLKRYTDNIVLTCEFSGLDCSLTLENTPFSYDIEFTFHHNYLKSFSSDFNINQFPEHQQHDICCNTQMILHDIINCKLQGAFRNMFLESKALSLLLCFQKCNAANQTACASCKFLTNKIEKEKILKAKEIILSTLNNPPTIPELSLQIGINQCYLKKGFKELFGTTVYDFVQEQRMLKAKMLLSTTGCTVSQVADQIGFSSASNFSSAFKKYSGVFPSELLQN
ncbi:MAG TPA: AraC family transcriptional regulator [Bacteroidia bacterium]|nr:AraC family transcriptional regulator [Bacteroidia bacterium]